MADDASSQGIQITVTDRAGVSTAVHVHWSVP